MRSLTLTMPAVSLALSFAAVAQDGHIDPAANAHRHSLTFAKHPDTTYALSQASAAFVHANQILRLCDSHANADQDVATAVSFATSGSLGSFGAAGDGLDVVTTQAELDQVLDDTTAFVKVVTLLNVIGGEFGWARTPGSTMTIVSTMNAATEGEVLAHEFGHTRGLSHRDSPGNPIMHTSTLGNNEVNLAETAAYHTGGTPNGPNRQTDLAFVVDDTGSMSEEIAGVRTALLNHLSTYPADTCKAFQLTTFKDNVTTRQPSTDLTAMQSQVSALVATGGDDCPEASAEALNAAGANIKDNGRAFLATDADPHPGQNISTTITALRSRGVRVDVILSGSCSGTEGLGLGSVAAFSRLAQETGGIFAWVPEVNITSSGATRYRNTALNIVQGALEQSVGLVQPPAVPPGVSTVVAITGASTNWQGSTTVQVLGGGVSVSEVAVLSPTSLSCRLTVDGTAALGFRDVITSTDLGGGVIETANGVGSLEIRAPIGVPEIVGVSPPATAVGSTVMLEVSGLGTHFSGATTASFGAGVTIDNLFVLSETSLIVTITIDPLAALGFRDLFLTTGTESVFGDNVLLVRTGGAPLIPVLTSVAPATAPRGATTTIAITGQNTAFVPGSSVVTFSGGDILVLDTTVTGATSLDATVQVTAGAVLGFRDVRVTTGAETAALLSGFLVTEAARPAFDAPTPCDQMVAAMVGVPLSVPISARATNSASAAQVTLTATGLPAGATVTPVLPATGQPVIATLNWTPGAGQVGTFVVTFTATDQFGVGTNCALTIESSGPTDCATLSVTGDGAPGTFLQYQLSGAAARSLAILLIGDTQGAFTVQFGRFGTLGLGLLPPFLVLPHGITDRDGDADWRLRVPNGLATGADLLAQAFTADLLIGGGVALEFCTSNVAMFHVGP